jgi:hypothetical protein
MKIAIGLGKITIGLGKITIGLGEIKNGLGEQNKDCIKTSYKLHIKKYLYKIGLGGLGEIENIFSPKYIFGGISKHHFTQATMSDF